MLPRQRTASSQMIISLILVSLSVVFFQQTLSKTSFAENLVSAILCVVAIFICFIPSVIIRNRTNTDFISFVHHMTPTAVIFVTAVYGFYFIYTANYFLLYFTDTMNTIINPDANAYVVAGILLLSCIYGAGKGINALTRCGLFIFVFVLLALLLIFVPNISNIRFDNSDFSLRLNNTSMLDNTVFFFSAGLVSAVFSCVAGRSRRIGFKGVLVTLGAFLCTLVLSLFFISYVLGYYGDEQKYRFFTLSKASSLGELVSADSLCLAAGTAVIFLLLSFVLISINRTVDYKGGMKLSALSALMVFILYISSSSTKASISLAKNPYILAVMTIIVSFVLPLIYLLCFWRKIKDKEYVK